jgi:hypothetical protein
VSRPVAPRHVRSAASLIAHQKRGDLEAVQLLLASDYGDRDDLVDLLFAVLALTENLTRSATVAQIVAWKEQIVAAYAGDEDSDRP